MNRIISLSAGLMAVSLAASAPAASADQVVGDVHDGKVQVVSFRGAPPFRRHTVDVSTLSAAEKDRLETLAEESDAQRVAASGRVAGNRGKPPYHRSVEPVVDAQGDSTRFARFEEAPDAAERSGRRGPPGKRFPFRHR